MDTLEVIQRYAIESYAKPGSNMEERSAYQFTRRLIAQAFASWAGDRRFERLVDIGSSTGFLTKYLKVHANHVLAVDVNSKVLAAIGDPAIAVQQDSLPLLQQLPDASADIVICTDTLYYLVDSDIRTASGRIAQILQPGGYFIINDNGHASRLSPHLTGDFTLSAKVRADQQLKPFPNFDQFYWKIEARYLYCRGLFNALNDPQFDSERDLSALKHRSIVKLCLKHRWIEHLLWLAFLPRQLMRLLWANDRLLRWLCTSKEPADCLWIYQKRPVEGRMV